VRYRSVLAACGRISLLRMKLAKLRWVGIIALTVGVAVAGGRVVWIRTRVNLPVDVPVSVKPTHVRTGEFRVNLKRPYLIKLEAKKRIPFDDLNCLLGVASGPGNFMGIKCNTPSVVRANWVLTSGKKIVAKGTPGPHGPGGWSDETIERDFRFV
jgi:hypothetical protein